ncbi:MAG: IMP dehydrogenase, partial [Candidatus Pacearchaeota archaeon]
MIGLTFDDVLMPPKWSDIKSRKECNTTSKFSRHIVLPVPIASANMRTVTDAHMCKAMDLAGGIGILHRAHSTFDLWKADIDIINTACAEKYGISIGMNTEWKKMLDYVYNFNNLNSPKPKAVVIDVAHAGNSTVYDFVQEVIKYRHTAHPRICQNWDIIVGNIATAEAASMYKKLEIDGLKVGVGPGAACTTRIMTGCGVPQFTAIQEISRVLKHSDIT